MLRILPTWLAVTIALLLLIVPIPWIVDLEFDNHVESFFSEDSSTMKLEKKLRTEFPEDEVLIILFGGNELYNKSFLKKLEAMTQDLSEHEIIDKVISVFSVERVIGDTQGFYTEPLLSLEDIEELNPEEIKHRLLADRFAPSMLVSNEGDYLSLIVRPLTLKSSLDSRAIKNITLSAIEKFELQNDVIALSGGIDIDDVMFELMLTDNAIFLPATALCGILLLRWLFRRFIVIAVYCVVVLGVTNAAMFYVAHSGQPYTMPVSMISPFLTALTTAFFIHYLNTVHRLSHRKKHGRELYLQSLKEIERPIRYTALTTVAGISSLAMNSIPPIQVFGIGVSVGVVFMYLSIIWIVPAILCHWDKKTWPKSKAGITILKTFIRNTARFSIRHAGVVVTFVILGTLIGASQIPKIHVETDMMLYFPKEHPVSTADQLMRDKFSGTTSLEIVFEGKKPGSFQNAENVLAIQKIKSWLDAHPQVGYSISMADIVEEMHWAFHEENDRYRTVPNNSSLISQYLFIYDGTDLYDYVNSDFTISRLVVHLNTHGAREIQKIIHDIELKLKQEVGTDLTWQIAGTGKLFAVQEHELIKGQLASAALAFFLIFVCLSFFWRSLTSGLIAMIPNVSPIIFIFIVMAVVNIPLDIGTAIISCVVIGIAVDDTIHIYNGYLKRIKLGVSPVLALMRTYSTAGLAITATTLILCSQFFLLVFSDFIPTHNFGLMTGVGLIAALIFDLFFLPAVLTLLSKRKTI